VAGAARELHRGTHQAGKTLWWETPAPAQITFAEAIRSAMLSFTCERLCVAAAHRKPAWWNAQAALVLALG
jgi:hypothetical protein